MKAKFIPLLSLLLFLFAACNDSVDSISEPPVIEEQDEIDVISENTPENIPSLLFVDIENLTLNQFNLNTYEVSTLFDVPNGPSGVLAYDPINELIYYTDYDSETILRNTLDGENEQVVVEDAYDVRAMTINPNSQTLYFASYTDDDIIAVNLRNFTKSIAVNGPGLRSYGNLQDMEYVDGKFYSITPVENKESVFRATPNSNNVSQVLGYEEAGYGYGLGVDEVNGHIYFNNVEQGSILRSDLNGRNIETVINLDRVRVYGLVADGEANKLYWTTWGDQIGMSNLDGSDEIVLEIPGAGRNLIKVDLPE